MAAVKRKKSVTSDRPLKQTKIHFGQKIDISSKDLEESSRTDIANEASVKAESKQAGKEAQITPTSQKVINELSNHFSVTDIVGPIFEAPDDTVIIHACNCIGSWSAGIAAAFLQRYPKAFQEYEKHCKDHTPEDLIGTAFLIPPMETKGPKHYVGCLFTSMRFGRRRDSPAQILKNTKPAMENLISAMTKDGGIKEIRMCQINSGLFHVPWAKTKAVIEDLEIGEENDLPQEIIVYSLPEKK